MPLDLLQKLEDDAPDVKNLENVETLISEVIHDVRSAMNGLKGSFRLFEDAWRHVIDEVAEGHTAEMQAVRSPLLRAFEKRLSLLTKIHELATWLHPLSKEAILSPDTLLTEIEGMKRLKANVFDPWQTADDLEDLAARDYPLTSANLDRIGHHRHPPPSWYAEESKPF